jgi:predicted nucleotidyltransferase
VGKVEDRIDDFLRRAQQRIRVDRVIAFGSRIRGDELKNSDLDIIVVSDDFQGVKFYERPVMINDLWPWYRDMSLDLLCYTRGEIDRIAQEIGIVATAIKEGRVFLPATSDTDPQRHNEVAHRKEQA